jgi:hypothetical protein
MQTVRDCIKESIKHTLKSVGESTLLEDKMYSDFLKESKLQKKHLDRLLDPSLYKIKKDKKIFLNVIEPSDEELTVLITIANKCKVEIADILSRSRKNEVVDARRIYTIILYVYFNYKLVQTGLRIDRDHTTIIHSVAAHDDLLSTNNGYRDKFRQVLQELYEIMPDILTQGYESNLFEFNKKLNKEKWEKLLEYQKSMAKNKIKKHIETIGED